MIHSPTESTAVSSGGSPFIVFIRAYVCTLSVQCHNPSDHLLLCPIWQPFSRLLLLLHLSNSIYLPPRGRAWRVGWVKNNGGRLASPWMWSTLKGEGVLEAWKIPQQELLGFAGVWLEMSLQLEKITAPQDEQLLQCLPSYKGSSLPQQEGREVAAIFLTTPYNKP